MGTNCPDIGKIIHYGTSVVLNSTYKNKEEQDVLDGENKTDCRQRLCFKTIYVILTTVQSFCVCCAVCACFYVCVINVIVQFCVQ